MTNIPLGTSTWKRLGADEPSALLKNRYYEQNPTNLETQVALISRPGLKRWITSGIGTGPIRSVYSQPGSFNDALFIVSGSTLYKIDTNETVTSLQTGLAGDNLESPAMVATSAIGAVPAYLYIADGTTLYLYDGSTCSAVTTPDGVGIISLGVIASYVICVVAPGDGYNGRFYWILPAETTIDPLNFATAERTPDTVLSVRVVGDQFWLLGSNSTEVWYPTGDAETPFSRTQGRVFDRGVWGGTDAQISDSIMLVDNDGVCYQIVNGAPQRVSNHAIEERIRKAIREQIIGV